MRKGNKSFENPSYEPLMTGNGEEPLLNRDKIKKNNRNDMRFVIGMVVFVGLAAIIYFASVEDVVPFKNARVSRNVASLSKLEKAEIIRGIISMKNCKSSYSSEVANAYDYFPYIHSKAAVAETQTHGSGFFDFPWHRESQNRFNKELQRCSGNPTLVVPYVDWTDKNSMDAMLDKDYLGADGNPANKYIVEDGPLGQKEGKFKLTQETGPPIGYLQRSFGNGVLGCLDIGDENCSEEDADKGSTNCVSWNLDSAGVRKDIIDNPAATVAFMKFPYMEAPDNDKNGKGHPPTVVTGFVPESVNKQNCPKWEDTECFRYFSHPENGMRLKCRHFSAEPISWKKCSKLEKFLPENPKEVFRAENEKNPHQVAPSYFSAKPDTYWHSCMEGIDPDNFYARGWEMVGASQGVHGSVHGYTGGTAAQPTAANDPWFQHLHGNADRLWAVYQKEHGDNWFLTIAKEYLDKPMPLFENPKVSIRDVLDFSGLSFEYDI